ncbi:MAG: PhzF family phenazine biosynthesis protein, partial [Bdellovibrionales bacterium]|nr:PhzF family phenazine biosynthesis protein [Bdellovibrionales bacterium]
DQSIPPIVAYAGAWHLVLATKDKVLHDSLEYDFEQLKAIMLREELTTLQLIYRESDSLFHSRNPFPVGGVVEDPATGAAAAAFGGYLRDRSIVEAPATITLLQGIAMGRPSTITVGIPLQGGITVSGTAISIE